MSVSFAKSIEELEELRPLWDELSDNAIERNIFFESWFLLPSLRYLMEPGVEVLVIRENHRDGKILCLFPVRRRSRFRSIPLPHLAVWSHRHCFLGTPLIRIGYAEQVFGELLQWMDSSVSLLHLAKISGEGPITRTLEERLRSEGIPRTWDITERFTRPCFSSSLPPEQYLAALLKGKRLKDYRKKRAHLEELGPVKTSILESSHERDQWLNNFLALEKSGWKGKRGTALAQSDTDALFFLAVAQGAEAYGKLLMQEMTLNGSPVAMKCSFVSGEDAFAFKIAYDEHFKGFSPGALLEFENLRYLHTRPSIRRMDSCADPDQRLFNQIWGEHREILSLAICARGFFIPRIIKLIGYLARKRAQWRERPSIR